MKSQARRTPGFNSFFARALILNSSYEPICVINWKRAIILLFQQKVEVLEYHNVEVHSVSQSYALPAVLKLNAYIRPWFNHSLKLSRQNVYFRDNHTCQYCRKKFTPKQLTFDHVIPVSRGGQKSWENIVAACQKCNHRKGNKTPKEAKMPLMKKPTKPRPKYALHMSAYIENLPSIWEPYFPPQKNSLKDVS